MQTHVSLDRQDDIAYLTFTCDEPGKPATLDLQVLDELEQKVSQIASGADALRAAIVRSDSPKYFVVGADIRALETLDAETIVPWVHRGHAVFNQLAALPLPTVARVEGYALGGGLELAMACDLIVASRGARFGQPEASLGLVAGWGGTHRLPRRIGLARAKELFFTAQIVEAERALAIGLVDFVGDSAEIDACLAALLAGIRRCSPLALAQVKKLVNRSLQASVEESCAAEAAASYICMSAGNTQARVAAFLESRKKRA